MHTIYENNEIDVWTRLLESYRNFTGNVIKDIKDKFYLNTEYGLLFRTLPNEKQLLEQLTMKINSEIANLDNSDEQLQNLFISFHDYNELHNTNEKWVYPHYILKSDTDTSNAIKVYIDSEKLFEAYITFDNRYIKQFFDYLDSILAHEKTHIYQHSKYNEIEEDRFNYQKYLSQKKEMAARSVGAIHELLVKDFSPRVILSMLKDTELFENVIVAKCKNLVEYKRENLIQNPEIKNYIQTIMISILQNLGELALS